MHKIACVFSFQMSNWVSCQKIVFNLHKSYALNKNLKLLNFNYSVDSAQADLIKTAQAIRDENPDTIVIMDHKPHPLFLLRFLLPLFDHKKPRITFHIFGDFTLYYTHWRKLSELLKGYEVDFLVASDRQKHLIDKFLPAPLSSIVCPFPVDKNEFSYQPALRQMQRKEWGLQEDDVAYVFTGRLSRQKRIHTLLTSFSEFIEKKDIDNAHLFLYGNTDSIGDQFLGKWETEGEYFRQIHRLYHSLPVRSQARIHFMGSVPNAELKSVYQGADFLANLSVHNDEDYGMSVAEAQCSGLPQILTDWGGLASFEHPSYPEATTFVPVKIGREAKLIHYPSIVKAFMRTYDLGHSLDRKKIAALGSGKFGVEAVRDIVENMFKQEAQTFEQFSPFFDYVLQNYMLNSLPYLTQTRKISPLYRKIYTSYVRHP